ncbi:MAG: tripartite tricarboxylate transporter substrate binding protein [Betaproteobacteria bacterium]|nr:tripartite tricarboxylate transporter substrate binding protein [Betaproteobacteria bacterium]MBI2960426.1 tripartite tricarboxylate transporter substrate binding protein [Betaproteobacteria bacterium]
MLGKRTVLAESWLAFCVLALLCASALAQSYPTHPVKLIVTSSAGGPPDRTARLLAQRLGETLKQPVVVENKTGAGTMLGADFVAKSAPDGHTLLVSTNASISVGPMLRSQSPYDPLKDFAHIALIGNFPFYFMVRSNHPAKTFREFVAIAKAKPGSLSYGSSGVGSLGNLIGELLKQKGGINILHVAYKGATVAVSDLLGGHIDATFIADSSAVEFVRSGKLRMLATATEKRVPAVPDVPTMNEIVPGVEGALWFGVSAPARTPQAVIERLQAEILSGIASSDMQTGLAGIGMTPIPLGAKDFVAFIQNEIRILAPIIKAGNIKVD